MTKPWEMSYAEPASALASYLDDLLSTAVGNAREQEPEAPEIRPPSRPAPAGRPRASSDSAPGPVVPANVSVVPPMPPTPVIEKAVREQAPVVADIPASPPAAPPEPDLRPSWSEKPFECLIFKVAGLQLAVPLVLLGAIHRMDERVKPIPGRPAWYMGMLPGRDHNLRVVDTAQWIMAGRVPEGARENYRMVIRLDNSEWALACDDVAQSFTLDPSEVRWRSARSKRPWLAGTVVKHMCALIDVGTMASLLARAEREQRLELD
ncbi:chemotaxis protein CheW [Marinobacter sp.]|uniref:chemotaxis protein CheW n=1 Tax=Marinobacter sp. TaxID=50741 RepID=UPI00384F0442